MAKILIVEEYYAIRKMLQNILADHDLAIRPDGVYGLRLLQEQEFDLVITDLKMNIMNGDEMLLQAGDRVPYGVIMISGRPGFENEMKHKLKPLMTKDKTVIFLTKPFRVNKFLSHASLCLSK